MTARRRHATWALALVLLFAQWGAMAHAYRHLASGADGQQHHFRTLACLECSSCAPLLTLAGGQAPPLPLAHAGPPPASTSMAMAHPSASIWRAYRSRAPPVLS